MTRTRVVRVGRERIEIESLDELRAILASTSGTAVGEVWLEHPDGPRLCMLRNGDRALLMFQTRGDDAGLLARARHESAAPGTVQFTLSNGQRDEHPLSQTVNAAQAIAALEHFFPTAALTPLLGWSTAP